MTPKRKRVMIKTRHLPIQHRRNSDGNAHVGNDKQITKQRERECCTAGTRAAGRLTTRPGCSADRLVGWLEAGGECVWSVEKKTRKIKALARAWSPCVIISCTHGEDDEIYTQTWPSQDTIFYDDTSAASTGQPRSPAFVWAKPFLKTENRPCMTWRWWWWCHFPS